MNTRKWGHALRGLVIAFLAYDVIAKLAEMDPIYRATVALGLSPSSITLLSWFEAGVLVPSLFPRTRRLGVVLITTFLGAAVAAQVVSGGSVPYQVFPIVVGATMWTGHALVDPRWTINLVLGREPNEER